MYYPARKRLNTRLTFKRPCSGFPHIAASLEMRLHMLSQRKAKFQAYPGNWAQKNGDCYTPTNKRCPLAKHRYKQKTYSGKTP